jgi:hypothetical protein
MIAEQYLGRSQLYRRLKNGSHGPLIERYAARLVEDGFCPQVVLRCISLVGGLLSWIARRRSMLTDLDERMVSRHCAGPGSWAPVRHYANFPAIGPPRLSLPHNSARPLGRALSH